MIMEESIKQGVILNQHQRLALNMYFTQSQLHYHANAALKPLGLSSQQFNILRILRGQKGKPIGVKDIAERMIDKMSNASRIVEKLRTKNLVRRSECPQDRRKVEIVITEEGLEVIAKASSIMDQAMNERLHHLTEEEAHEINTLLDKINSKSD